MSEFPPSGIPGTKDQILRLASTESDHFRHNFVGTEHVLCALCHAPEILMLEPFAARGIQIDTVRAQVLKEDGFGPPKRGVTKVPTPRLERIFLICQAEMARHAGLTYAQTILLGIIDEGNGVAARVLKGLGVDLNILRKALLGKDA